MALAEDVLYIVVGIVLLVVAWTVYATINTEVVPSTSTTMISLALFIAAAGLAVRGAIGLVRE